MMNIMDFENLKIYKNKIYYPVGVTAKNKDTALVLTGRNFDDNRGILYDPMVRNRAMYPGYFIEDKYNFTVFNKPQKINALKQVSQKFGDMRDDESNAFIKKYAYNYEQLKGLNAYIDMSIYLDTLFTLGDNRKSPARIVSSEYCKLFGEVNTSLLAAGYTSVVHVIDLTKVDLKDASNYDRMSASNVFAVVMYLMRYEFDTFVSSFGRILFRGQSYSIMVNPLECTKDSYKNLMSNLNKIKIAKEEPIGIAATMSDVNSSKSQGIQTRVVPEAEMNDVKEGSDEAEVFSDKVSNVVNADIVGSITGLNPAQKRSYAFTGVKPETLVDADVVEEAVEDEVDKLVADGKIQKSQKPEEITKTVETSLQNNEKFMTELQLASANRLSNMMSASNLARNKVLAKKQAELKFKGKTISQITSEGANKELKVKKLNRTDIINKKLVELRLPNLDKQYNEDMYDKDIIGLFDAFKDSSIPVYILDIKKEDSSDDFNKKSTWTVKMESADRVRHTLTFDVPNFINDSFFYIGGNQKNMYKQMMLLPISKTAPDEVQICTNYNKAFVRRVGDKLAPKSERLRKIIPKYKEINAIDGDSVLDNKQYVTTLEFDEMAKAYISVSYKKDFMMIFNIEKAHEVFESLGLRIPDPESGILPVGVRTVNGKKVAVYYDTKKEVVQGSKDNIVDYMVQSFGSYSDEVMKDFYSVSIGKKYMYTAVTIMALSIPLVLVLGYAEGMTKLLDRAEIEHTFSDTRPIFKDKDKTDKGVIEFSDGYLIYDKYPYANSLLLNGLATIPTKNYAYSGMDSKETYLDIFNDLFGSKRLANALDNFYDLLIDPITKQVLEELSLPTDYVGVFVHANKLLEDSQYINQIKTTTSRIRGNEIVSAVAYKTISKAYEEYRASAGNKTPKKMSVQKDQVIKNLMALNTVEDYSTLNPVLEAEKARAISFKGHSGMNMDRAYTVENRSYDTTMLGILSLSSPPTGSVGIVRQLPLDSNILSTRGFVKVADKSEDLSNINLFSPAELLVPTCSTRDDAPRIAMTAGQAKHVVPCKKYDKLLMGNGVDKIFAEVISDDFAFKSKEDGQVIEVDDKTGIMVLKYKNGETDFIELYPKVAKNGGGGFYISNKLTSKYTVGSKFKKGDVIASNDAYFDNDGKGGAIYKAGTLTKIALAQGYYTYEDSSMVSKQLCKNMSTEIVMKKEVTLGKNANVESIVKIGDKIEVGEPLMVFDNSYDDEGINKMFAAMDTDIASELSELGKKKVKSKYSGVIEDIKVYYTVDLEEMSDSLAKTVKTLNKGTEDIKRKINKYKKVGETNLILPSTDKVPTQFGKVKGVTVGDGVYIEFYIKYQDELKIGDKITFFTALKSVICDKMEEGREAYSEFRPDEEVSAFLGPDSVLKRMVASVLVNMFTNKVLIELKRSCSDLYYNKKTK